MCQQPSLEADLKRKHDVTISPRDILSAALYPKVFDEYKYVSQARVLLQEAGSDAQTTNLSRL